jgi:subtilisin family serine protease
MNQNADQKPSGDGGNVKAPGAAPALADADSGDASPAPASNEPVDIAATHLTKAEIEKAKALGFKPVSETVLPLSNTAVQQLRAPAGVSRGKAKAMLLEQMPLGKFAVNHTYHIFKDQEGDADKPAGPCADAACMPAALINWQGSLRSCTKDVKIGIIDTSFDLSHPAFRELKVSSGQFLGGEQPSPLDWHGTAVLSLLAGDPKSGTPGLIPDAHFLLATAFKTDASGNASTDSIRLVAALEWMNKLDVKYVNMSFSGPRDPLVEAVIQRMRREGVVFIAAAGNQGPVAPPSYPAAYPDVIAVTAVNRNGQNYRHANRGDYIDVAAPGVDVLAALPDGRTGFKTGTSFAAPFVTAIVATQQASTMTTKAVWKPELLSHLAVRDLGPPGPDPIYGQGLALAPASCTRPDNGAIVAAPASKPPRENLPPPMGAGMGIGDWGPAMITTSGGKAAD